MKQKILKNEWMNRNLNKLKRQKLGEFSKKRKRTWKSNTNKHYINNNNRNNRNNKLLWLTRIRRSPVKNVRKPELFSFCCWTLFHRADSLLLFRVSLCVCVCVCVGDLFWITQTQQERNLKQKRKNKTLNCKFYINFCGDVGREKETRS